MPRQRGNLPQLSAEIVARYLRGEVTDYWKVAASAYDFLGYCVYLDPGHITKSIKTGIPSNFDAANEIDSLIKRIPLIEHLGPEDLHLPIWLTSLLIRVLDATLTT